MQITSNDIADLALGSVFLATGGGGDPHIPQLLTEAALKQYGPVQLVGLDELPSDAFVAAIGNVGAPTVSLELLPSGDDASNALDAYEQHMGRKVDAVISFEIGGGNSLIPISAAAAKGIPVINGDGMGRALPEAQMMTYAIAGIPSTPALAYDYAGNTAIFNTKGALTYEHHVRSFAMAAGGMITTVEHGTSAESLKGAIIPDTLSFAVQLGRLLTTERGPAHEMAPKLERLFASSLYGEFRPLYSGKVTDKTTRIVGGYDVGHVTLEAFEEGVAPLSLSIKNEYLIAHQNDNPIAMVPDLIIVVDEQTSTPINAERLRYGQRVAVFAVGCPPFYRSAEALKIVCPRAFGFDQDFIPLEDI